MVKVAVVPAEILFVVERRGTYSYHRAIKEPPPPPAEFGAVFSRALSRTMPPDGAHVLRADFVACSA
jgi:hypothetical protein